MKKKFISFEAFQMLYGKATRSNEDDKRTPTKDDKSKRADVERNEPNEPIHVRDKSGTGAKI